MDIRSVCICDNIVGGFRDAVVSEDCEVKSLPMLSVVQSTRGSYRIALGDGEPEVTGDMGVFIAPRRVTQRIWHMPAENGTMDAQWVFIDVEINRMCKLEDLYDFPLILPARYNDRICALIKGAAENREILKRLPYLHGIVEILFEAAVPAPFKSDEMMRLRTYMENHYAEQIDSSDLSRVLGCSRSAMFRRFRELFDTTPCRYINEIRIRHAQMLLSGTDTPIGEIAAAVGIPDAFYFSRVFKQMTGITAIEYRKKGPAGYAGKRQI